MRREVAQFGVKVVVVEPGGVATQMSSRGIATANTLAAGMTPVQHQRYDALIGAITAQADAFTKAGVPAERASAVLGRTLRTEPITEQQAMDIALPAGTPDYVASSILATASPAAAALPVSGDVQQLTGRAPRTFARWAAQHATAFS